MSGDKSTEERVHLDTLLGQLGGFGRYQLVTMALLALPYAMESMYSTHYVFSAADVQHRCRVEECEQTSTHPSFDERWVAFAAPDVNSRRCLRHPLLNTSGGCGPDSFDRTRLLACSDWVYEEKDSFVAEFQLACEDWKRTLVGTVRSAGGLVGLLFAGQLSDRYGRKLILSAPGTLVGVLGLAKTFAATYVVFIALEFLEAMFASAAYNVLFTFTIELVHSEKRIIYSACLGAIYSVCSAFYSVLAWQIPYWRHLLRVVYAPAIFLCLYYYLLDESVRWLLSKGKQAEAIEIILKMGQSNCVKFSNKTLTLLQCQDPDDKKTASPFRETFKSRVLVCRLCVCCVWWVTSIFVYYGLTIGSVSLGGDPYWSFALSCLVDVLSNMTGAVILDRLGRNRTLSVSFAAAGTLCVAMVFVPPGMVWLSTTVFLLGKFGIGITLCGVYYYTAELFPTCTRNSMHATCSCVGRVGSLLAPQMPLLVKYWSGLPAVLYALCSLLAALLTLLTPDTRQARLPDTAQQAENISQLKTENLVTKM